MKSLVLVFAVVILSGVTSAQTTKIGYVNVELVMTYMPESSNINKKINTKQRLLQDELTVLEESIQAKYAEYEKVSKTPGSPRIKNLESEIQQLSTHYQKESQEAELTLAQYRAELMEPMTTRLANALDSVRIDNGYHMILNSQDGSGLSIVLSAPAEDDLTRKVLKQLGIDPKAED